MVTDLDLTAVSGLDRPFEVRPFREGERVRVRYRPECPHCEDSLEGLDGQPGVVSSCPVGPRDVSLEGTEPFRHGHAPGHAYAVRFDQPWITERFGRVEGACLAAVELERMESQLGLDFGKS